MVGLALSLAVAATVPALGIEGRYLAREEIALVLDADYGAGGVLVERVVEDSAAEQAGLKLGDLILQFESHQVCSGECLLVGPRRLTRVSWIGVTFVRAGRVMKAIIDLSDRPLE
ncbi:MAG TPA: PDZ domain-containing protein [Candidatus Polarisedimenticolaceae bacterium]|nr:PDZ domain-containing protein [Candidatus Polarisedimenticolaceae bacterium]